MNRHITGSQLSWWETHLTPKITHSFLKGCASQRQGIWPECIFLFETEGGFYSCLDLIIQTTGFSLQYSSRLIFSIATSPYIHIHWYQKSLSPFPITSATPVVTGFMNQGFAHGKWDRPSDRSQKIAKLKFPFLVNIPSLELKSNSD